MQAFEYFQPKTVREAVQALHKHPKAIVLAGGTDLLVVVAGQGEHTSEELGTGLTGEVAHGRLPHPRGGVREAGRERGLQDAGGLVHGRGTRIQRVEIAGILVRTKAVQKSL